MSIEGGHERQQWDSSFQFMLATISYAVGLGNIWRFPSLAYENGGGAFLIPYVFVSFLIGFPLLYLELSLGQFARAGPAVLHGRVRPYLQGIGVGMIMMAVLVSIYYNVIVAWCLLYLFTLITGRSYWWTSCEQDYNTLYCYSQLEDNRCSRQFSESTKNANATGFYFNGTCFDSSDTETLALRQTLFSERGAVSPAEEFFENYVLEKTETMDDFGGINFKILICYAVAWIITAMTLRKGVKLVGKLAYFTATVPYIIIAILFVRSITLEGASIGLDYFLLKPDMSYVFNPTTLRNAASHICYSLSVGFGGMLSMASYNPSHHNPYSTAITLTVADAIMSLFGGLSVFSVLGFMSKQLNLPIDQVIQSGTGLAFVAYPEAMSRLPLPWLWSFLFFFMILILGVSTQFGFAECICTAIYDLFPSTQKHRAFIVYGVCFILWCCGLVLCTRAGIFYFNVFNDYSASFALMLILCVEVVMLTYIYGIKYYITDLRSMFGPPMNKISKWIGATGIYIQAVWSFVVPTVLIIMCVLSFITQVGHNSTYGKGIRTYTYPDWSIGLGWFLSVIPLLCLPIMVAYNIRKFSAKGHDWREMFRLQPKWPSFEEHFKNGTGGVQNFQSVRVAPMSDSPPSVVSTKNGSYQQTKV
uniref:Transporter n=1 Tax=Panagrellus redivivus TaxID=6233 RepID=A0A7E4VEG9_PANRE